MKGYSTNGATSVYFLTSLLRIANLKPAQYNSVGKSFGGFRGSKQNYITNVYKNHIIIKICNSISQKYKKKKSPKSVLDCFLDTNTGNKVNLFKLL